MKWQTIPGWDRYEAREDGAVRSLDMAVGARGGKTAVRKGRLLSPARKTNGYWAVTLTNGRSRPQIGVHVIVARTFIGEQPIGLQVLHSDGNKDNNHYSNLRYGTQADNIRDAQKHGTLRKGENHPMARLNKVDVDYIRMSSFSAGFLANHFRVTRDHILAIRAGRVWKSVA